MSDATPTTDQSDLFDAITRAIAVIPYATHIGMRCVQATGDAVLFELPAGDRFVGNPVLRAFHGGVISGLLDCAMQCSVMGRSSLVEPPILVSHTVSFLGSASANKPLQVQTQLTKPGKRIVAVHARAFQDSEARLSAKASAVYRLSD